MVMFVDDHDYILRALKRSFGPRSFGVRTVAEALEAAATFQPRAVLVDARLADECGIKAVPLLRRLLPDAVIIVFTALCTNDGRRASKDAGATAYIDKMHLHRIREIVEDIIADAGASARESLH